MNVTVIGGGGTVGSTAAYTLAVANPEFDVTLVDVDVEGAEGHTTDIHHARCHVAHAAGDTDVTDLGTVNHSTPGPQAVEVADVLLVTASAPRPPDSAQRGGRVQFLNRNSEIIRKIAGWFRDVAPRPVVVVTNPLDLITHSLWESSGWPREYVLGYSLSETARMAAWIADLKGVSPAVVDCPMLGEHGEHMVPAFSRATVNGDPLTISDNKRADALDFVRDIPYEIIQKRGTEESSRWVTGRGAALVVERLLEQGTTEPICLSVPLDGEYGFEDVTLSVPVRLDESGWTKIIEWDLSAWESERLEAAYSSVSNSIN
jgi:malate dehydrogenase